MVLQFLFELLKSKYMFSCLQLRDENIKETLTQYIYLNTKEPYHKPHTIPKIYRQPHAIDHIISLEMLILSEDSRDLDTDLFTLVKYVSKASLCQESKLRFAVIFVAISSTVYLLLHVLCFRLNFNHCGIFFKFCGR